LAGKISVFAQNKRASDLANLNLPFPLVIPAKPAIAFVFEGWKRVAGPRR